MHLVFKKFELKVTANEEGKSEIPAYSNISSTMKIQQRTGKPTVFFVLLTHHLGLIGFERKTF